MFESRDAIKITGKRIYSMEKALNKKRGNKSFINIYTFIRDDNVFFHSCSHLPRTK